MRRLSREDQDSKAHPDPPPMALASPVNWLRQASTEPKSRVSAMDNPQEGNTPLPPRLSKYCSCRNAEFAAINSPRLRPLMVKVAALLQSNAASSLRMAFRRLTAPE